MIRVALIIVLFLGHPTSIYAQASPTTIEMTDGSVLVGRIVDATDAAVWLEDESGEVTVLSRD